MTLRILWAAGAPARLTLIGLIRVYQVTFAGLLGGQCRFHPTCSEYAVRAIRGHGALKGAALGVWRVLRCSPLSGGGVDHVPPAKRRAAAYDAIIQRRAA
jgi:putative membrane protein insertion efficiency factor